MRCNGVALKCTFLPASLQRSPSQPDDPLGRRRRRHRLHFNFAVPSVGPGRRCPHAAALELLVAQASPSPTSALHAAVTTAIADQAASAPFTPLAFRPLRRFSRRRLNKTSHLLEPVAELKQQQLRMTSAKPLLDMVSDFGPSGVPRSPIRQACASPRVRRPRSRSDVVADPAHALTPVPAVWTQFNHSSTKLPATALSKLPPPPPPATLADAILGTGTRGAAAELRLHDFAWRYFVVSHTECEREKQAEPGPRAGPLIVSLFSEGWRPCLENLWHRFPFESAPFLSEIRERAGKGRLRTTDDGIDWPVREPSPPRLPCSFASIRGGGVPVF